SFDYLLNALYTIKECLSYGALYTTDYCCSNESLVDKIICDLNKVPDSPHLHNFLNDSPSISENSSQSPPHINHHYCYECSDPLDDIFCKQCTCMSCGKGAHYGYNCPLRVSVISNPKPYKNQTIDELPQTLPCFHPTCYYEDESPFTCNSTPNIVDDSPNVFNPPLQPPKYSYEFCGNDAYYGHDCLPQQKKEEEEKQIAEEQAAKARYWKIPICYDDDEDYIIAITPKEPDNSLSMRDEYLDTIPAMKSDEFIKSSVENLVPNPKIRLIKKFLYDNSSPCPPEAYIFENSDVAIKYFSPSPIPVEDSNSFLKEIDLSFTLDNPMSSGIEEDDYDSERNILILEELLSNDSLSLPENKSFHFDIPSSTRPPAKPPNGNSRILNVKVMGDISEHNIPMPRLMLTQPTLVPNQEKSPNLLSH
nr:hypothetical protein [Tanacetum cinerariifolium]